MTSQNPATGTQAKSKIQNRPSLAYEINFTTPGTYTLWLRGYPTNARGDSAYVGLTPGEQVITTTGFAPRSWNWAKASATLPVTQTGVLTLNIWMREDGLRLDRLVLTTDTAYLPNGFGLAETERLTGTNGLALTVNQVIQYEYDHLYRLTEADYSTGALYEYDYDPVGNRLAQIINGDTTSYQYDAANRLEAVSHQAVTQTYTFDDNGNLLNTGVMTNSFDAANRLVSSSREGTMVEPIYNGVGDRVGQTVGTTTTHFALDVQGLPEVIYTSDNESYLHLPGVIMTEKEGEVRYLLSDGLGSIRQAVAETGAVVGYNEFDPYGNPVQNTRGGEPYGYTGEWYESYLDLLFLRARWYASESGTFLSRDPVESEPPYQYVRANPINQRDPSGKIADREGILHERYTYSCNCGWIDWAHANPGETIGIYTHLKSKVKDFEFSRRFGIPGNPNLPGIIEEYFPLDAGGRIYLDRDFVESIPGGEIEPWNMPTEVKSVLLGIRMETEERFEGLFWSRLSSVANLFGPPETRPGWLPGGTDTYFTEEDLISDLLAFYRFVDKDLSRDLQIPEDWDDWGAKARLAPICGFPAVREEAIKGSLSVLNEYPLIPTRFTCLSGPECLNAPGGTEGWHTITEWGQPRLARCGAINQYCDKFPGPRKWPERFNNIQPEHSNFGGKWWWGQNRSVTQGSTSQWPGGIGYWGVEGGGGGGGPRDFGNW